MTDFDAIVVGAGHNGLTSAVLLQKAGLRTLCLDSKLYAGGMASTVELFDGFKFEIAGSVQIPTSATVSRELGLDDLPNVDLDVMSVSLRGVGDEPLVYYADPMKLLTHINEVHGAEAVNGMAGLMAWCQAPTRALGRFDAGKPPKTLDEMYACATNEFERSTITDLLFGSVTDVLDRYLPDKEKNGALRGMLSLLACNTTYRGPATPGTAAALAYGFAVPDENALLVKKLRGGIGTLTSHLCDVFTSNGGELRLRSKVDEITVADGRVTGVRLEDGSTLTAPIGWAGGWLLNRAVTQLIPGTLRAYPIAALLWSGAVLGLSVVGFYDPSRTLAQIVVAPWVCAQVAGVPLVAGVYGIAEGWLAVTGSDQWWPLSPPKRPMTAEDATLILGPYDTTGPGLLDARPLPDPGERSQPW